MHIKNRELNYRKLLNNRDFLYKILNVNHSLANLLCDIMQNRFWFFAQQIILDPTFPEIDLIPSENAKSISMIFSGILGAFLNDSLNIFDITELFDHCRKKTINLGNNLETACFLIYQNFGISPLCLLFFLNWSFAKKYIENLDPTLCKNVEQIINILDIMDFSTKCALLEEEWIIAIYEKSRNLKSKLIRRSGEKEKAEIEIILKKKSIAHKNLQTNKEIFKASAFECEEIFEKLNFFGFPKGEKAALFGRKFPFNSLILLSSLRNIKNALNAKNKTKFVVNFDLVLSCCEKIRFLKESPLTFEGFKKNSWVKLISEILFLPNHKNDSVNYEQFQQKNEDFTMEFFLLPSIYEKSFLEQLKKYMLNYKNETFMLQNYLSDFVIFFKNPHDKTMEDTYIRQYRLYENIDKIL